MTKQEIIDKINTGIRGQGSQVDIGGVLGDILEGILDLIPSSSGKSYIHMNLLTPFEDKTPEEASEIFNISLASFNKLVSGEISSVIQDSMFNSYLVCVLDDGDSVFFFKGDSQNWGASYYLFANNGKWTFSEV